jgi:hypothetical protein
MEKFPPALPQNTRLSRMAPILEASLGHPNCEAMERREWMPSFAKIFST